MLWKIKNIIIKFWKYLLWCIWSKILSSSRNTNEIPRRHLRKNCSHLIALEFVWLLKIFCILERLAVLLPPTWGDWTIYSNYSTSTSSLRTPALLWKSTMWWIQQGCIIFWKQRERKKMESVLKTYSKEPWVYNFLKTFRDYKGKGRKWKGYLKTYSKGLWETD